eukprot:jgi/Mesen1/10886/ME000935S10223
MYHLEGEGLYFGCVVGRVANRVANASFTIDGHRYQSRQVASEAGPSVCFTHCSPDGDQAQLRTHMEARPRGNIPTPISLAHHTLMHPGSGRVMELHTSAPAVQFYTGNYLSSTVGKGGAEYGKHAALCLETQVNEPNFPSITVRPGETYTHVMIHRFSTAAESES